MQLVVNECPIIGWVNGIFLRENTCLYFFTQRAGVTQKQQIGVTKNCVYVVSESNHMYVGCFSYGVPKFRVLIYESFWVKANAIYACACLWSVTLLRAY